MEKITNELELQTIQKSRIGIIGLGNIGLPMAKGLIQAGILREKQLFLSNRVRETTEMLSKDLTNFPEVVIAENNDDVAKNCDIIFVALKQKQIQKEFYQWKELDILKKDALLVSLAAGVRIDTLIKWLGNPSQPMARVMPNIAVAVGKGVFGWTVSDKVTIGQCKTLKYLLSTLGTECLVDSDEKIDTITAVSGSCPAYFFYLAEEMIETAVQMGMQQKQAQKIVQETLIGAATLLDQSQSNVTTLLEQIISKGGTTEAALKVLYFRDIIEKAMKSAKNKAAEIGNHFDLL
ncbi:MAG: pyrroline-5-carboxylate reductase [bacterium]|nr:pyrroline-5-carboxylate reductase [bacterium]